MDKLFCSGAEQLMQLSFFAPAFTITRFAPNKVSREGVVKRSVRAKEVSFGAIRLLCSHMLPLTGRTYGAFICCIWSSYKQAAPMELILQTNKLQENKY
jgi:hypothetical protein